MPWLTISCFIGEMVKRWPEIAAKGIEILERLPAGRSVLVKRAEAAAQLGVTKETLHNYIAALEFVQSVRTVSPAATDAMLSLSATTVGVYSRWWRSDPEGVVAHAIEAAREGWSASKITEDERTARRSSAPAGLLDRALAGVKNVHQNSIVSYAMDHVWEIAGLEALPLGQLQRNANVHALSKSMGVTEVLQSPAPGQIPGLRWHTGSWPTNPNGGLDAVAVMEIERGVIGDAHRRNARNTIAKAALAATVHPIAMILLPDADAVTEFIDAVPALKEFRLTGPAFDVAAFLLVQGKGAVILAPAQGFAKFWSGADDRC